MHIEVEPRPEGWPLLRGAALSIVIRSFKGRRHVAVHLFRPDPETRLNESAVNESQAFASSPENISDNARLFLLETFTQEEQKQVVDYLSLRYASRLESITGSWVPLPVPDKIQPLSKAQDTRTVGRIRFDQIPNYPLNFPLHGIYDLAQHQPLAGGE